jgi:hypothetical protein
MNDKEKCRDCPLKEGCDEYKKKTNEEWLKSLNTKELAKWIRRKTHGNDEYNEEIELAWEAWLKEKHHDSVQG